MAVTYQAAGTADSGIGSINIGWPSHQAGDLGILIIETDGAGSTLTPSGWTHISGSPITDVANNTGSKLHVLWKRAASGSESSVATGDSGDHQVSRIFTFRGVKAGSGSPIKISTTGTKVSASTTVTYPAITTTAASELVILIAGRPNDSSSTSHFSTLTNGNLSSINDRGEAGTTSGNGGGFVLTTATKSTAGSTGTSSATVGSSVTNTYAVFTLVEETTPTATPVTADAASFGVTPEIVFTGTDDDGDSLEYQIQIDTVNTFDSQ